MYEIAPDELCTFSFTHKDVENKTEKFVAFAIRFVRMLDMSIDLLGPDMDILDEQLSDLGVAHKHFGVSQRHYDLMGKALIYGLGVILCRNTFIDSRKDARETVFKFMSTAMVNGAESVWELHHRIYMYQDTSESSDASKEVAGLILPSPILILYITLHNIAYTHINAFMLFLTPYLFLLAG